jgi:AcrR family transcriptional regulator
MRAKKIDKRKVQGAETKRKLYEIAEKLFTERNITDVSIEDITDEAGISKGAFYVHYASKDELAAIIIAEKTAKADNGYKTFLESLPDDMTASSVLLALTEKISDTLSDTLGYENMKTVYQLLLAGTIDTDSVKGYGRELYIMLCGILEKGIRRGEFISALPAETLSRHFVMALRGVSYEWCVHYPDFDLKEQFLAHIRLLISGIQAR